MTDRSLEYPDAKANHYWIKDAGYISMFQYSGEYLNKYIC